MVYVIEDILGEESESTVVVSPSEDGNKMIAIPKQRRN